MASASSSSARHLFSDSKKRLCDRVGVNVNNLGSVARQIVRGSKSNEILGQSIKNFTQVDIVSDYSSQNLHKMQLILQHVDYQHEVMLDNVNHMDYLKEQVTAMER
ncbi:PREDICTED: BLOC-1-related complex subunit 7 [Bactrocera latifrons]|nr:PREDICTED: BLOC-1-related complex subunit 7 [Bactrocera latifrons]